MTPPEVQTSVAPARAKPRTLAGALSAATQAINRSAEERAALRRREAPDRAARLEAADEQLERPAQGLRQFGSTRPRPCWTAEQRRANEALRRVAEERESIRQLRDRAGAHSEAPPHQPRSVSVYQLRGTTSELLGLVRSIKNDLVGGHFEELPTGPDQPPWTPHRRALLDWRKELDAGTRRLRTRARWAQPGVSDADFPEGDGESESLPEGRRIVMVDGERVVKRSRPAPTLGKEQQRAEGALRELRELRERIDQQLKQRRVPWTRGAAITELQAFCCEHDHWPTRRELSSTLGVPSDWTLRKLFGSFGAALAAAKGIEPLDEPESLPDGGGYSAREIEALEEELGTDGVCAELELADEVELSDLLLRLRQEEAARGTSAAVPEAEEA